MQEVNFIPREAFDAIYQELKRKSLDRNDYRNRSGSGVSQTFGLVNKRSMPPDISRQSWLRPYLHKLLWDFGAQHVDVSFNAVTVNMNYRANKHYDRNNIGNSFLVAFGEYTGGKLLIHEGDLSGAHNVQYNPITTDFSKVLHSVEAFEGERFSLVYYMFARKGIVPQIPVCTVKEENGDYVLYRGNQKITKKNGLPHPLRNRKKKQLIGELEDAKFDVVFD
jgi:hypothetical protein